MEDPSDAGGNRLLERIERLLDKPCWVIDLLPRRVPADAGGQFFEVEQVLLGDGRLRRKFADTLLMLNCYHDFVVVCGEREDCLWNPKPQELERWVLQDSEGLSILLPSEDALIGVATESTCMALYNPSEGLLELVEALCGATGLFVWRAD